MNTPNTSRARAPNDSRTACPQNYCQLAQIPHALAKNMSAEKTSDLADLNDICDLVACGMSVAKAITAKGLFMSDFYGQLAKNRELAERYARARETRADARAEAIDDLSQRVIAGEIDPNAARVAMDAQKWLTARENPKRYGDKLDLTGVPASSVNVLLSTRDKLKRLKRAREESEAPAAIEGGESEVGA